MKYVIRTIGFFWLLPVTILVWLCYILPLVLLGELHWVGWQSYLVARFSVYSIRPGEKPSWYKRRWVHWFGQSLPCAIVIKEARRPSALTRRMAAHEERHCDQQFVLGPLFYPAWLLLSAWLWIRARCEVMWYGQAYTQPYWDNWLERDARRYAKHYAEIDGMDLWCS